MREFLKNIAAEASASAAVGGMLNATQNPALAQAQVAVAAAPVMPPLAAKIDMRRATCTLGSGAPTVVAVLDNGKLIGLAAEARRQKRTLP